MYISWTIKCLIITDARCKYEEYLYKFETLVPFRALGAAISGPLPLLETPSKIFNANAVNDHLRFSLNLCNCTKNASILGKNKMVVVLPNPPTNPTSLLEPLFPLPPPSPPQ